MPTEADVARFWSLIETAWDQVAGVPPTRRKSLIERDSDHEAYAMDAYLGEFLANLRSLCEDLSSAEVSDMDRVLERKLHDIDRADIREVTDGSDDGFLYCRSFAVAMGRDFYEAVVTDPSVAVLDAECESMAYFFANVYYERRGTFPDTDSGISRETRSDKFRWA
ncbi:DUF4240 domain-containing protein [Actinophytocola oryzae]|uniref:Uncharacterized protein DUF4240 n=1 Tax=Actinophytocola oryzae TaxID=502181 RepID=A0A4R7UX12_9PSEU|nr:DUF4240 domain-containing protein [Actinophytocola oryzae]TDV41353.1 uncharacterized protein DUF4240 [Actinophytocola oryzae]